MDSRALPFAAAKTVTDVLRDRLPEEPGVSQAVDLGRRLILSLGANRREEEVKLLIERYFSLPRFLWSRT